MLMLYIPHNDALVLHQGRGNELPFLFFYSQPLMTLLDGDGQPIRRGAAVRGMDIRPGAVVRGGGWLDNLALEVA